MGRHISAEVVQERMEKKATGTSSSILKTPNVPMLNNAKFVEIAGDKNQIKLKIDFMLFSINKPGHPNVSETDENNVWYNKPYYTHAINKHTYICPKTFGQPCPICDKEREVKSANNCYVAGVQKTLPESLQQYIRSLGAREKLLYPVLWRDEVHLLEMSRGNLQKQLELAFENTPTEIRNSFFDDDEGYTAKITLNKKQFGGNDYWEAALIEFEDVKRPKIAQALIDQVEAIKIEDLLEVADYAELKAQLDGAVMEEEVEEEDDDTPAVVAASSRRKAVTAEATPAPVEPEEPAEGFQDTVISDDDF